MDLMAFSAVDCVAVLAAALSSFLLGGLWYSGPFRPHLAA
jgi:hypothetical protein